MVLHATVLILRGYCLIRNALALTRHRIRFAA